jgi:hypothetical protein
MQDQFLKPEELAARWRLQRDARYGSEYRDAPERHRRVRSRDSAEEAEEWQAPTEKEPWLISGRAPLIEELHRLLDEVPTDG